MSFSRLYSRFRTHCFVVVGVVVAGFVVGLVVGGFDWRGGEFWSFFVIVCRFGLDRFRWVVGLCSVAVLCCGICFEFWWFCWLVGVVLCV